MNELKREKRKKMSMNQIVNLCFQRRKIKFVESNFLIRENEKTSENGC